MKDVGKGFSGWFKQAKSYSLKINPELLNQRDHHSICKQIPLIYYSI